MIYFLHCVGNPIMQMEASWIFTNIAAGSYQQTKLVSSSKIFAFCDFNLTFSHQIVDRGVIQLSIKLLKSPFDDVVEQALWTLGNIIGENVEFRDKVISFNLIDNLLSFDIHRKQNQFLRTLVWVCVNCVRCKDPQISVENVRKLIPKINELLRLNDNTIKVDALWALTYIGDCNEAYIQEIVDSGIVPEIIPLLSTHRFRVMTASMRLLGNIATGSDEQTEVLISNNLLIHIRFPLMHHNENLRRMALWCLSNITVGTRDQINAVFHSGLLHRIIDGLRAQSELKTRKEALITISNLIQAGTVHESLDLINNNIVGSLFELMLSTDAEVAAIAQNSLRILFENGKKLIDDYSEMRGHQVRLN